MDPEINTASKISARWILQGQNSSRTTGTRVPDSSEITFPFQPLLRNVSMILLSYAENRRHVCSNKMLSLNALKKICTFAPIPCCWLEKVSKSGCFFFFSDRTISALAK